MMRPVQDRPAAPTSETRPLAAGPRAPDDPLRGPAVAGLPPAGARGGLYYGWVLVAALGVTETVSWGVLYYAFGVFVRPMEAELGWSRAAVSGAFALAVLLSGVAAVPVGRWLDRRGPRALMTAGSIAGTLLVLAWAAVRDLAAFYAVWAGIGVVMAAVLYEPAFAVVAVWFRRRRARAFTALTLMAGLASTVFLPLAGWLLERQGWRGALVTLAAVLGAATIVPHALLLRRRPEDLGLLPDGAPLEPAAVPVAPAAGRGNGRGGLAVRDVLRLGGFPWLAAAFGLSALAATGVGVHLVPYLTEQGFGVGQAAALTGAVGATQLVGRLAFAPLEGRVPRGRLAALVLLLQPLALLTLLLAPGPAGLAAFVVLFGAGRGAATLARATLVAGLYGPARYASISGVLALCLTLAQAAAPLALGAGRDALGTYRPFLWGLVAVSTVAAVAAVLAVRRAAPPGVTLAGAGAGQPH